MGAWSPADWRYASALVLVPALVSFVLLRISVWTGIQSTGIGMLLTYLGVVTVGFVLGRLRVQLPLWIFLMVMLSSLVHFAVVSYAEQVGGNFISFYPTDYPGVRTLLLGAIVLTFALLIGRAGRFFARLHPNEQFVIAVEFCIIIAALAEMLENNIRASEALGP